MSAQNNGQQLVRACDGGDFPGVRSAVSSGASVNYQDRFGYTPAIYSCLQGHSDILQYLLDQGANAELANNYGYTPLHIDAWNNKYECAVVVVRHGVALDTINTTLGWTALWHASRGGHLPIVQLLVQGGADFERACNDGLTPLAIAREIGHPEVVMYLSIESNWRRRKNYATTLNSIKGAPTDSKMMKAFQCHDVARMIGSYI
jgi:ankyrin repeat protein